MLLSDDPGWYARAQQRRSYCASDAPWIAVAECGWPHPVTELGCLLEPGLCHRIWQRSSAACSNYLRAVGLAHDARWVHGHGPRAIWHDHPGRWFVAHAGSADVLAAARAHFAGAPAPTEPKIGRTHLNGMASRMVRREKGEPAGTQGDVVKAAIAMIGLDPAQCFGAGPFSPPVMMRVGESNSKATIDDGGLMLATPMDRTGWHDEFRRRQPHSVPPAGDLQTSVGPIRVERIKWSGIYDRARRGDPTVPQSPLELAVGYAETVGIHAHECWGIAERQPGADTESAYAQIVYRPRVEHDEGRSRFAAYLASLGMKPEDLALGHPEGYVAWRGHGITMYRPYKPG